MRFFLRVILFVSLLGSILTLQTNTVFIIYSFVVLSFLKKKRGYKFFEYLMPLLSMTILGFVFASNNMTRDVLRDFFYFTTPIFLILFGAIISDYLPLSGFVSIITYFGLIYSSYYIFSFFILNFQVNYSLSEIRGMIGTGNILTILSFYFLIFNKAKERYLKISVIRLFGVAINLLAIFLFNSRTYLISFVIFYFFFYRLFPVRFKFVTLTFAILLFSFLAISNTNSDSSFYLKVLNSFDEISIKSGNELNENNSNYRSFETIAAFDTYLSGNVSNFIVGQGFGKLVDLKMELELNNQIWQFIPLLHNGFMYILVKTGLLGFLFFFIFFIKLFPSNESDQIPQEYLYIKIVLKSLIISCLLTNIVICSFFNLEMQFLLICLGAFYNYLKLQSKYSIES